ncbi:hypothetical protein MPTK1_5g22620 [Marchantia polymorpha subsp. ruderalis]|uniref:C2HC/C3H-type domain-containing protein n=2 Tax=Marchantia polymorpha TaxID=3197 RepID=A0AAF6BL71_MARPO|nr:hypothetical protein MARPO_0010s0194 [Marchantia polymorpha]BBN12755.1 hypothetical protein Mp_5g22620 [Marchantia polymorpha subsp. ruderalis]|eukprot:PTQ46825.1 hypothetical protein MARPO_0010s0194 [Marchantia polymorpha]
MNIQAGKGGARPRMLMCYLCGREFGSKSLPIHLPQCQKKWIDAESLKPAREQRPMPEPPAVEVPIKLGGKPQVIDDFNEAANKQFLASLEQCPYCKRKFAPEPYKHHQRSCTASNPAKPAGTALVSTSLSNNKRLQPYTVISGSKKSSISKPVVASKPQRQPELKKMIAEARSQKGNNAGPGGAGEGTSASTSKIKTKPAAAGASEPKKGPSEGGGFCDECGATYGRAEAKFCSSCGAKRKS